MSVSAASGGSGGLRLQEQSDFTFTAQDVVEDKRPIEAVIKSRRDVTKVSINGQEIGNKVVSEFSLNGHLSVEELELDGFASLETVRLSKLPRLMVLSMQQNTALKNFTVSEVPLLRDFSVANCRRFTNAMVQGVLENAPELESLNLTLFHGNGELRIANLVQFKELYLINCFGIKKIVLLNLPRLEGIHTPGLQAEIVFEGSTPQIHMSAAADDDEDGPSIAVNEGPEPSVLDGGDPKERNDDPAKPLPPEKGKCILL